MKPQLIDATGGTEFTIRSSFLSLQSLEAVVDGGHTLCSVSLLPSRGSLQLFSTSDDCGWVSLFKSGQRMTRPTWPVDLNHQSPISAFINNLPDFWVSLFIDSKLGSLY